jgi:hypothetical protein
MRSQNPEVRYREGYEEGAWALFTALEHRLSLAATKEVRSWLRDRIEPWRADARQKNAQGIDTPEVTPPRLQISN